MHSELKEKFLSGENQEVKDVYSPYKQQNNPMENNFRTMAVIVEDYRATKITFGSNNAPEFPENYHIYEFKNSTILSYGIFARYISISFSNNKNVNYCL